MEADPPRPPDVLEEAIGRLHEAIAVLDAIDLGDMLGALPEDPADANAHQRAVSLLAVLRRDLVALRRDMQAAGHAEDAIARALTGNGAARA